MRSCDWGCLLEGSGHHHDEDRQWDRAKAKGWLCPGAATLQSRAQGGYSALRQAVGWFWGRHGLNMVQWKRLETLFEMRVGKIDMVAVVRWEARLFRRHAKPGCHVETLSSVTPCKDVISWWQEKFVKARHEIMTKANHELRPVCWETLVGQWRPSKAAKRPKISWGKPLKHTEVLRWVGRV